MNKFNFKANHCIPQVKSQEENVRYQVPLRVAEWPLLRCSSVQAVGQHPLREALPSAPGQWHAHPALASCSHPAKGHNRYISDSLANELNRPFDLAVSFISKSESSFSPSHYKNRLINGI